MTDYEDANDDRSRPAQDDSHAAGPGDNRAAQSESVEPAVRDASVHKDAADAAPVVWSGSFAGGSAGGSDDGSPAESAPPSVATEPPFWRDETAHIQAPVYRGGKPVIEPALGATHNPAADAAPASALSLGYDVPGYDPPALGVTGYVDASSVSPHDPWATGPVAATPRADTAASTDTAPSPDTAPSIDTAPSTDTDAPSFTNAATDTAATYPWTQTSTYGAPSWNEPRAEPRTGPSYVLGGPYEPSRAGDNADGYGTAAGSGLPRTPPENASKPKRLRTAILGTAVAAALIGGAAGAGTVAFTDSSRTSSTSTTLSTTGSIATTSAVTNGTVSAAAKKITPSVVTIQVVGSSESGTGSGVIVRSDGYILTNNHVVSVAGTGGTITVQTSDGRSAKATIVGTDATDDLAVIKVTGLTNLTAATFAKSSSLTVGQSVVAIGAPLGLSDTVTAGIVSATARTVRSGDNNEAVFAAVQTDAAINPGNSGGALVDLNGNVIGINAAIASTSSSGVTVPGQQTTQSGSIGIGFAIPSDEASRIANELITTGKATHAVLGVEVASSSSTTSTGATLRSVTSGGSAASAGLKAGDVVTAVDGARISDGDDLIAAIRSHAVKDSVAITYTRSGASHTAKVTLSSAEN